MLAAMYLVPLALFVFGKGRGYYLAPAYPMLLAMGSVMGERWVGGLRRGWLVTVEGIFFAGVAAFGALFIAILIPVTESGPVRDFSLKINGDLREEFGWQEMVRNVAAIRDSLSAEQRTNMGVMTGNYGEQGAVEMLGPQFNLPEPMGLTNSAWLRGYPASQPTIVIVVGFSKEGVDDHFTNCRLAGHIGNREGIRNEESEDHSDIFVCGPPRLGWARFWAENQRYG